MTTASVTIAIVRSVYLAFYSISVAGIAKVTNVSSTKTSPRLSRRLHSTEQTSHSETISLTHSTLYISSQNRLYLDCPICTNSLSPRENLVNILSLCYKFHISDIHPPLSSHDQSSTQVPIRRPGNVLPTERQRGQATRQECRPHS